MFTAHTMTITASTRLCQTLLYLLLVHSQLLAAAPATFCNPDKSLCISGATSQQSTCFSMATTAKGWFALGIGGTQMSGSDMWIGWRNSSGGVMLANGKGSGHVAPSIESASAAIVSLQDPGVTSLLAGGGGPGTTAFSFCRSKSDGLVNAQQKFIWAISPNPPSGNVDTSSVTIAVHATFGNFAADFTGSAGNSNGSNPSAPRSTVSGTSSTSGSPVIKTDSSFTYQQMIDLHAVMMWLAWIIAPMMGIFYARYLKSLGHAWFRIHMLMMGLITGGLCGASLFVICLYKPPPHFSSVHAQLGLAVCLAMVLQIILGILSNIYFDPDRTAIPLLDKAHSWLGRTLVVAALVNIQFGFTLSQSIGFSQSIYVPIAHYFIVAIIVLVFLFAEFKIGPTSHSLANTPSASSSLDPELGHRSSWMDATKSSWLDSIGSSSKTMKSNRVAIPSISSNIGKVDQDFERRMKELEKFTKKSTIPRRK